MMQENNPGMKPTQTEGNSTNAEGYGSALSPRLSFGDALPAAGPPLQPSVGETRHSSTSTLCGSVHPGHFYDTPNAKRTLVPPPFKEVGLFKNATTATHKMHLGSSMQCAPTKG